LDAHNLINSCDLKLRLQEPPHIRLLAIILSVVHFKNLHDSGSEENTQNNSTFEILVTGDPLVVNLTQIINLQ